MGLITGKNYYSKRAYRVVVFKIYLYRLTGKPLLNLGTEFEFQRVRIEIGLLLEVSLVVLAHVMVDQGDRH